MANGIPNVAASISGGINTAVLDVSAIQQLFGSQPRTFGIFDLGGNEILTGYSNVVGFSYQEDQKIATHPIEQGGFASYNKVALPFGAKLQYTVGGGNGQLSIGGIVDALSGTSNNATLITTFIATVRQLVADTKLYAVVTPEYTWQNINVTHHDFKRSAQNGFSMLTVDIWLEEVRQGATAMFANTQMPDGQAQQNGGNVQTAPPPANAGTPK